MIKPVTVIPIKDPKKYAREFSDEFIEEVIKENKMTSEQEEKCFIKFISSDCV